MNIKIGVQRWGCGDPDTSNRLVMSELDYDGWELYPALVDVLVRIKDFNEVPLYVNVDQQTVWRSARFDTFSDYVEKVEKELDFI